MTTPSGGTITILETAAVTPPPVGYLVLGQSVQISAPIESAAAPLDIRLTIDASLLPPGVGAANIGVIRNGVPVADCLAGPSGGAVPDPCIAERLSLPGGDVQLRIFTSTASEWAFVVVPEPVGVLATKFVIVDKLAATNRARVIFVAKDPQVVIGDGTDLGQVSAHFAFRYGNGSVSGAFVLPPGPTDGTSGWVANADRGAKYVNSSAPAGPTQAKLAVVKVGHLVKLVGKGVGDEPIDLPTAGDPNGGGVYTAFCIRNDVDSFCFCSWLANCSYETIAMGSGAKLVCRAGIADAACTAAAP